MEPIRIALREDLYPSTHRLPVALRPTYRQRSWSLPGSSLCGPTACARSDANREL